MKRFCAFINTRNNIRANYIRFRKGLNPTIEMMEANQRTYFPALDSLRGFAIVLVFLSHVFSFIFPLGFGWVGVDLFFVLSGFLITELLLITKNNQNYFRNFFAKRFLRIAPLYFFVLLMFFYLTPSFFILDNSRTFNFYYQNQIWLWTYLQNWLFVEKGMPPSMVLSHFWSLAIEEQFYLVWPFAVLLLKNERRIQIFVFILILIALLTRIFIWSNNPSGFEDYYCNTVTRMDSILAGSLIALLKRWEKPPSYGKVGFVFTLCALYLVASLLIGRNFYLTNPFLITFGYTFIAVFFACIVYILTDSRSAAAHLVIKIPGLQYLGKISYGIYVFHVPIYLVVRNLLRHDLSESQINATSNGLLIGFYTTVITLFISSLSFYFFEKPILMLKRHFN